MSPLTSAVLALLVSMACAGLVLPQNNHGLSDVKADVQDVTTTNYDDVKADKEDSYKDIATDEPAITTQATTETSTEKQKSPINPAISRVATSSSSGSHTYAYHGQTQHSVESNSVSSHTLTSSVRTFPTQAAPVHELHFPVGSQITFFHPEHTSAIDRADHAPATTFIHADQPQFISHGYVAPNNVGTYTVPQPAITQYTPIQTAHPVLVNGQPHHDQVFTVNLASPKYGYGYTIRGTAHAEHQ